MFYLEDELPENTNIVRTFQKYARKYEKMVASSHSALFDTFIEKVEKK